MSKTELAEIVAAVKSANDSAALKQEAVHVKDCKVHWRRRIIIVTCLIGVTYAVQRVMNIDGHPSLIAIEGFVAVSMDKFIFGIA